MAAKAKTILFAGGGTGGHLYPSLAVAEQVTERAGAEVGCHFACSDREVDRKILAQAGATFSQLSVRPLPRRPQHIPGFLRHYFRSMSESIRLIEGQNVGAVVAMGGFVCGPVVAAARKRKVPVVLVNLDAVPGKANRWLARKASDIWTIYPTDRLPDRARQAAMPLRQAAISSGDPAADRQAIGLEPDRPVLLVTGASQGATSINQAMAELAGRPAFAKAVADWQIYHLTGADGAETAKQAYEAGGIRAVVEPFTHQMGRAWGAADLAVSRAGAGSVAEVIANTVPAVFLPYPYHKDQHQKLNAEPAVAAGGAVLLEDRIQAGPNADALEAELGRLIGDQAARETMVAALDRMGGREGALALAEHALGLLAGPDQ